MSEDIFFWSGTDRGGRRVRAARRSSGEGRREAPRSAPEEFGRLTLREAAEQYGVPASTLGSWCRRGAVVATLVDGPSGPRWMVDPASVESRLAAGGGTTGRSGTTSPAPGGGMLVPRDAWDRLIGQLTNLHETGQQLAEARERAARAETEAAFLRERLAELRAERDEWRSRADRPADERPGFLRRLFGHSE